jgi:hypothetical protein
VALIRFGSLTVAGAAPVLLYQIILGVRTGFPFHPMARATEHLKHHNSPHFSTRCRAEQDVPAIHKPL